MVGEAFRRKAVSVEAPARKTSEYFGMNVFDRVKMRKFLSKETYQTLVDAIDSGTSLDRKIGDHVAAGIDRKSVV